LSTFAFQASVDAPACVRREIEEKFVHLRLSGFGGRVLRREIEEKSRRNLSDKGSQKNSERSSFVILMF